ncbi:hypothetical protein PHMEG_000242 [Phytophthora megakarya]|uniref:FHA domain-containing protein n=1 Tax=Phytophthora megakarya TaxID=4795 RepID=A0A225X3X2_9STRA|nr:hypothetical protein PHMEG_000242 [Phytophthora megakarya]
MDTPGRAAFLCTSTAAFHPPDWACMPIAANSHARLEAFRDSRHCATYMVATQRVNLFGRDQESCDHVLGNPSVSRKHAAVIHNNEGGIYMVDLMSRHGTYVGRKKIPPHDPYLLHEGDVIRFGQSVRVYILKGASSDGNSAPVKKSWGRKLLTKLVNAVCYGTLKDEKVVTFITGVLELGHDDRQGVADTLVERLQAKYEFYATSDYDDQDREFDSRSTDNEYAPPMNMIVGNGTRQPPVHSVKGSGFNFIGQSAPESTKPGSAFGFIGADPVDEASPVTSSADPPSGQFNAESVPRPPSVDPKEFLLVHPSVAGTDFEDMWESANDESVEWSVDLGSIDAHELDPRELQTFLQSYRMMCASSKKVAGQQQWLFVAEQKTEGTLFLVDITVMPGLTDMSVTLKWIVNSILYRNGHLIFTEILKYALHQFAEQTQTRGPQRPQSLHHAYQHETAQNNVQQQNGRESEPIKPQPTSYTVSQSASRTASHATSRDDEEDFGEDGDADEDSMFARDYLTENPAIDAGKFEQVWATATEIASLSYNLNEMPEVDEVIELFRSNCLGCLASGSVDKLVKFFFFAEMTELQCVFCVEMAIGVDTGILEGTVKRLAVQKRSDEEEEQIDSSFVSFIEEVLQEL